MHSSRFDAAPSFPLDPIMRLWGAFNADPRPDKLNLVLGVYVDEKGLVPRMRAVIEAERQWVTQGKPKTYRPIEGATPYMDCVQALLFGVDAATEIRTRAVTVQSIGGTGALKICADVLKTLLPGVAVAVSNPSWENHRQLFQAAGFEVIDYPYYRPELHGVDFSAMTAGLDLLPAGSVVVLHACCHNPTGNDLTPVQWRELVDLVVRRDLVPLVDIAYQGFGDGLAEDALAVRLFAQAGIEFFVASSFSKSFSLYGERVGALTIVARDAAGRGKAEGLAKRTIRTSYSSPPTHGAMIVEAVLGIPELRDAWDSELAHMRKRIHTMRDLLVAGLAKRIPDRSFDFVQSQKGMFSYSGLTAAEVARLRDRHAIFAVDTGRICVAALNSGNVERVADAIADAVKMA